MRPPLLFDLDGTLIDSIELILSSMRHAFEGYPGRAPTNDEWRAQIGRPLIDSFREFVPHLQDVEQQSVLAQKADPQLRSPFQRDIIKLFDRLTLYHRLKNSLEVEGTVDFRT